MALNVTPGKTLCHRGLDSSVCCYELCSMFDPAVGCIEVEVTRAAIRSHRGAAKKDVLRLALDLIDATARDVMVARKAIAKEVETE